MKEQITELRNQGLTYREIKEKLSCSISTISYYLGNNQKEKTKKRTKLFRDKNNLSFRLNKRYYNIFVLSRFTKKSIRIPRCFTYKEFLDLLDKNKNCYISGLPINFSDLDSWQMDHVIPYSKGGKTDLTNLRPCLKWANQMKHDLSYDELLEKCKLILLNKYSYPDLNWNTIGTGF